ncbi:MAG: preprotein translocase subunit SecE [Deltaproteobacteria bacterium]|nr:preprotein translocase subunit SecE [Deltaproteobacteria bacterium]MCB9487755.1 preprotein translocase subunit SecE [Deltaproteobacteria bacterium]
MWQFVRYDVPRELKKVAWPTPQDTATSTVVVIVLSVIFSIFFFIADRILQFLILGQLLGA